MTKPKKSESYKNRKKEIPKQQIHKPIPRPSSLSGKTSKWKTGCGNIYVTINVDENGRPLEVFSRLGKAGGCSSSQTEAIGRLLSFALRGGMELSGVMEQLRGIGCHQPIYDGGEIVSSCADAISKAIKGFLADIQPPDKVE